MNKHINETIFGEINIEQKLINEDSYGTVKIKGKYNNVKISVYGGEGPIPHFHLSSKELYKGRKLPDICIGLFVPSYFVHGDYKNTGTFENNSQSKIIDNYIRNTPYYDNKKNVKYNSIWEAMVDKWFENNPTKYNTIYYCNKQPDYTKIDGYIKNPSTNPVKIK